MSCFGLAGTAAKVFPLPIDFAVCFTDDLLEAAAAVADVLGICPPVPWAAVAATGLFFFVFERTATRGAVAGIEALSFARAGNGREQLQSNRCLSAVHRGLSSKSFINFSNFLRLHARSDNFPFSKLLTLEPFPHTVEESARFRLRGH